MKMDLLLSILLITFVILSQGQDLSPLTLNATITIQLDSPQPASYRIVVPADVAANEDLYIHVEPTVPDPFQVPYLTVTADNNYLQNCYNAHEEFAGICKIGSNELKQGRQFSVSVKCVTSCTLNLQTYLSQIITVPLGRQLPLKASSDSGSTVLILVQVPSSANYTAISLLASITNIEQNVKSPDQKLDMLINYGDEKVQAPTDASFMVGGVSLFTGGRGVHLTRQEVVPGSWIKVYLKLESGVSVIFSASAVTGQNSQILLGAAYFDSTSQQQYKTYALNVSGHLAQIENKTIELVFDIYSGNPRISIAFDSGFTQDVPFTRRTSATSYSLSPSLRESFNFVDTVYIKVSSSISSEYYFYTKVIREDAAFIEPYLAYFDQVEQGQVENYIMIERFSYPATKTNQIANYSFKVEIVSGKGSFYFKRCQSIEKAANNDHNLEDCLILSVDELLNSSFLEDEIQNKDIINGNMMSIEMRYDIGKCNELERKAGTVYRECAFQIIAVGESEQPFVFSLTAEKKTYNTYLRQNKIVKDYISKASYVYYSFSLPTLANVTEINIFTTTFSGSSALIVSTVDQFPTLDSPTANVFMESGQKSSIVLKKEQIAQEIFISVYAYQFTEVNLGVVVHRSSDNSLQNYDEIALQLGHMLTYTLSPIQQTVSFKINSNEAESIIVSMTELVGHSSFQVVNIAHIPLPCVGKKDNPFKCEINTTKNTFYRIVVKNKQSKLSKFTVSYNDGRHCTNAALNLPTYVVLHSKQNECYTFPINRDVVIKFDSSFTHTQILNKQIKVELYINGHQLKTIDGSHYDISAADMSTACPFGLKNPGLVKTCQISIDFTSNSDKTTFFNFVMEEEDAQIALFDGIVESISDLDVSFGGGKSFYYHVYSSTPIKIFFTTKSIELTYFLVAKLVSKADFLKQNQQQRTDMYQEYLAQADSKENSGNLQSVQLDSAETSIVSIDEQFIRRFCDNLQECYLLLTVAPINLAVPANPDAPSDSSDNSNIERINYEIEVTQEETYLALGESKMGFVEEGQVYTYLVDREDAIINIRNMNKDGQKSLRCATVSAGDDYGTSSDITQLGGNFQIAKTDEIDRIYVRGDIPQCSYQISYISIAQPIKTVRLSTPYELALSAQQTQGFLFYNLHPSSFRIMQMVSAGKADIYILPFNQGNLTLSYALSMDFKAFPLVDRVDGDFVVSSSNQFFCSNCFYYVVVTTSTKFIGEVMFLRLTDAVPLTVNHIFKELLSPVSEVASENYVFYSLTSFSITFNILSGSIQVILIDPKGNNAITEIVSETKTFSINAVDYQSKEKIEFFSKKALYQVKVTAVEESEFYLRLDKSRATERIFEGYPSTISFTDKSPTTVQFVNSQALDEPLMIMADVIEQEGANAILSFSLLAELESGQEVNDKDLYIDSQVSENTYILNLKNIKGAYFISVATNVAVNVTFLLFKNTLTHITPSANHFFNSQGIFQLYSSNKNVMVEIFNCKGDLSVTASKDYQDITNPNSTTLLLLKRPNYGGHYVFGVEDVKGSYFLKVDNKDQSSELQYLISYYYYDKVDPYESIDAVNYDVTYQFGEQGLVVRVNPPVLSVGGSDYIRIKNINYWAYASAGRQNLNRYSHCAIESNAIETFGHANPDITIENAALSQLLTDNANPESVFVSVQASIEVQIVNPANLGQKNYPKTLTILYNIIEVHTAGRVQPTVAAKTYWFTDSLFVFICWMLLPFVIAGVFIYYVLNYCFRRWMNSQHNMIEDSDGGTVHGSRVVPTTVDLRDMKSTTFQLRDMKSTTFELVHRKTNLKDADSASAENHVKQSEEI